MHWKHKALTFRLFEHVPHGRQLHYFVQRHVTRSIPRRPERIARYNENFLHHARAFRRFHDDLGGRTLFEFGAGSDLCSNVANYCLGIDRQIVVDIQRLARIEAINHVIAYYREHGIETGTRRPESPVEPPLEEDLAAKYGITYQAPMDAAATGLPAGSIDYIVSTATLEHIPEPSIRAIMRECARICASDGVVSMIIDYADHYAKADRRIGSLNFLRYTDQEWAPYNPASHYQNRLRHPDYAGIFTDGGFEIVEEHRRVDDDDLEAVRTFPVADRFRHYDPASLAASSGSFVLRKRTS